MSLTQKSTHKDTFILQARLDDHHIETINMTKLDAFEELTHKSRNYLCRIRLPYEPRSNSERLWESTFSLSY